MTENSHSQKKSILAMIVAGIASVFGWSVGQYTGFFLLIPVGLAAVAGLLLSVLVRKKNKPMVPASAIQLGHAIWMMMGTFAGFTYNFLLLQIFDKLNPQFIEPIAFLFFGLLLAFRPTIWLVAPLAMYQLPSLVINGIAFAHTMPNTNNHKALLVHVVLRAVAMGLMIFGLVKLHKNSAAEDSATSPSQDTDSTD